MAFQTGTASSLANLLTQLFTFATANGWTQDQLDTVGGEAALHKNNVWVSFRWIVGTEVTLSVHQALGYTGGNSPGSHPNDSGNGFAGGSPTNGLLDDERCVRDIGNGPFPSYFFFENDSSPAYIHVVAEISTGVFRHFGFGEILKTGDWTGGEYAYGHYHMGGSTDNNLTSTRNTTLLDGLFFDSTTTFRARAATIHLEGLPGQDPATRWGQVWGQDALAPPDDAASNPKDNVQGGYKAGPVARQFGFIAGTAASGLIPQYPIALFYHDLDTDLVYYLGTQPDVRGVNIRNFAPKDEIVIGSDTWVVFPDSQRTQDNVNDRSFNRGIAYKKVTA